MYIQYTYPCIFNGHASSAVSMRKIIRLGRINQTAFVNTYTHTKSNACHRLRYRSYTDTYDINYGLLLLGWNEPYHMH